MWRLAFEVISQYGLWGGQDVEFKLLHGCAEGVYGDVKQEHVNAWGLDG